MAHKRFAPSDYRELDMLILSCSINLYNMAHKRFVPSDYRELDMLILSCSINLYNMAHKRFVPSDYRELDILWKTTWLQLNVAQMMSPLGAMIGSSSGFMRHGSDSGEAIVTG